MNKLSIMTAAAALLMAIAVPAADHDQKIVFVTSAAFDCVAADYRRQRSQGTDREDDVGARNPAERPHGGR